MTHTDIERRQYRHRELFEAPIDEARLFPLDPRAEQVRQLLADGAVTVRACQVREMRKVRKLDTPEGKVTRELVLRDWHVIGSAGDRRDVEIVVNDTGRFIFGTCSCPFFEENPLNHDPCAHLIALLAASEPARRDLPTSAPAPEEPAGAPVPDSPRARPTRHNGRCDH